MMLRTSTVMLRTGDGALVMRVCVVVIKAHIITLAVTVQVYAVKCSTYMTHQFAGGLEMERRRTYAFVRSAYKAP